MTVDALPATSRGNSVRVRRPSGEPPPLPKELNRVAIAWFLGFAGWVTIWGWVFLSDSAAIWITELDLAVMDPLVGNRVGWLTSTMRRINTTVLPWSTAVVGWVAIVGGLAAKRVRHVLLLIAALVVSAAVATSVANHIARPRPLGVEIIGDWEGFSQPSRPITMLAVVLLGAALTLAPAGRARRASLVGVAAVLGVCAFAQVYVGVEHPSDPLAAATVGVAVVLFLFRTGAPEKVFPIVYGTGKTAHLDVTGARGEAIKRALSRQLGIKLTSLSPVGLAGSAGSTPLRVGQEDGPDLFAKLYASSHLRSDRSYKLGRTLLYGRLEDEQRFTSVRRLLQHEDYMLHVMTRIGVDTMQPVGIIEITPDREYMLVTEFLDGAVEISEAEITETMIDTGLETVKTLWMSGLAHRDIKPANIMVQGERLRLIDVAFGQTRPSPWRQAVDLANMMLVLALGSSAELVYERALRLFSEDEIAEAFAASRGVTLPSALRADVKRDGRELLHRFRELAPDREAVTIQRWTPRRFGLTIWVGLVVALMAAAFIANLPEIGLWP